MAVVFALPKLFDDVVALFAQEGTIVSNAFGWRESGKQPTSPRIVWIPGDSSGALGTVGAAKYPGRDPRPLATLFELFTVELQSADYASSANAENERKQYEVVRALYDAWYRACYIVAHGTFQVVSDSWVVDKKERRRGAMIRATCTIQAMIPDAATSYYFVEDVHALLDVEELDHTEQNRIPEEEP